MRSGVEKLGEQFDRLVTESREIEQGRRGHLTIALASGETSGHYYSMIKEFSDTAPNTEVEFVTYNIKDLPGSIKDNTIDIAFSVASNPWYSSISRPEYRYIKVGLRHDCLYLPVDHPLAGKDAGELSLADFRDDTFIVLDHFEMNMDSGPMAKTFSRYGFMPKFRLVDSLSDLIVSLQNHQGICIGSNRLFLYQNPQFKKLYLSDLSSHTEIILWSLDNPNPCIGSFVQCVKNYLSAHPDFALRDNIFETKKAV